LLTDLAHERLGWVKLESLLIRALGLEFVSRRPMETPHVVDNFRIIRAEPQSPPKPQSRLIQPALPKKEPAETIENKASF
jgi:hypothetical protein